MSTCTYLLTEHHKTWHYEDVSRSQTARHANGYVKTKMIVKRMWSWVMVHYMVTLIINWIKDKSAFLTGALEMTEWTPKV